MEFLQLRYFLDSAATENFAKTAQKYMVPPSSISITIKRLENELGCELFERHGNRITLNANGMKLQKSLRLIFDELDSVTAELSSESPKSITEIKILANCFKGAVVDTITEYKKKHPNISFTAIMKKSKADFDNYDVIIDNECSDYENFERSQLCQHRLRLKVAKDSLLCGRTLTMKDLQHQPFVITSKDSPHSKLLIKACKRAGFTPNIAVEVNDQKYFDQCVEQGLGIGLTCAFSNSPQSKTALLSVTDFDEWMTYYVYYKNPPKNPQVQEFIDFIKNKNF